MGARAGAGCVAETENRWGFRESIFKEYLEGDKGSCLKFHVF